MLSRSELKQIWFDAPRVPVKQQQLSKIRHFKYGANKIDHQWYFYSLCKGTLKLMVLVTGLEKCQLTRGDFQYVSCIWNTIKRMGIMELPTSFLNFVFNVGFGTILSPYHLRLIILLREKVLYWLRLNIVQEVTVNSLICQRCW